MAVWVDLASSTQQLLTGNADWRSRMIFSGHWITSKKLAAIPVPIDVDRSVQHKVQFRMYLAAVAWMECSCYHHHTIQILSASWCGREMTKTAHGPKRPIVLVQNGPRLHPKRPTATSKTAHADVQNGPRLGQKRPTKFLLFVSDVTYF